MSRIKYFIVVVCIAIAVFSLYRFRMADLIRMVQNVDLAERGIDLHFGYVPPGLYSAPFVIDFSRYLYRLSGGRIDIAIINAYTVGNFEKDSIRSIESVSNMLDPTSKYKDTWFGVFIIEDDSGFRGRRFLLKDAFSGPDDPENLNVDSLIRLPELDQKLIVFNTHQNQRGYTIRDFEDDFFFEPVAGSGIKREIIIDRAGRRWLKVSSSFRTVAALTDIRITDMRLFSSIRSYIGLPTDEVYRHVEPWHPIVIKGSVLARYFECQAKGFWAVVYYNGSAFQNREGEQVDNWVHTDLKTELEKMFQSLEIGCQ